MNQTSKMLLNVVAIVVLIFGFLVFALGIGLNGIPLTAAIAILWLWTIMYLFTMFSAKRSMQMIVPIIVVILGVLHFFSFIPAPGSGFQFDIFFIRSYVFIAGVIALLGVYFMTGGWNKLQRKVIVPVFAIILFVGGLFLAYDLFAGSRVDAQSGSTSGSGINEVRGVEEGAPVEEPIRGFPSGDTGQVVDFENIQFQDQQQFEDFVQNQPAPQNDFWIRLFILIVYTLLIPIYLLSVSWFRRN